MSPAPPSSSARLCSCSPCLSSPEAETVSEIRPQVSSAPAPQSPASPCVKRCAISPTHGLCTGCGRTLDEIAAWSALSPRARAEIMAGLPQRRARAGLPS
ncbi:DUF1289 domain-containing protein [Xanthobacter sp. V4C-4]|uniref:DUF1289 domain-containing protein n=1 Tax=Xanthobacter cornucopiae TaxID=3119924 RepID=UPI00372C56A1